MSYSCIICGKAAGSAEHLFPSALGGMRKNKKIYCDLHNNAFGHYVSILEESLRFLNASIGLTTDRRSTVKPAMLTSIDDGSAVLVTNERIYIKPDLQSIVNNMEDGGQYQMEVGSDDDIEELKRLALIKGYELTVTGRSNGQKITVGKLNAKLDLGGDGFLRSIGYIGLTFFAHYFQNLVRLPELCGIKDFVRFGDGYRGEDRVGDALYSDLSKFCWWVDEVSAISSEAPFDFWHAVAICIKGGVASAYVSLFGIANFYIRIADGINAPDQAIVTYIDPLAESEPREWCEKRGAEFIFSSSPEENFYFDPRYPSVMNDGLADLMERIIRKQAYDRNVDSISRLNKAASVSIDSLKEAIDLEVFNRKQMIFNILHRMAGVKFGIPEFDLFVSKCVVGVPSGNGVSDEANAVLDCSIDKFSGILMDKYSRCSISVSDLEILFDGPLACQLVLASVFECMGF